MIEAIRLVPENGALAIELVGELAGILALTDKKTPRPFGPRGRQLTLVAGARYQRYLSKLVCRVSSMREPRAADS